MADPPEVCRIAIVGASLTRLRKVVSLVSEASENDSTKKLVYLPCVARFASYKDETGNAVRYLVSIDYFDSDWKPSTLAEFFDSEDGIAGVTMGMGIEGEDANRIETLLLAMAQEQKPVIKCIQPNSPHRTMKEEMEAYKSLSAEEKELATQRQTMGPGRMAKFIKDFAKELMQAPELEELSIHTKGNPRLGSEQAIIDLKKTTETTPRPIQTDETRYLCRTCRSVLFVESDLQDPPHEISQHHFSHRKRNHTASACQSYFLNSLLDWMPESETGKISCYHCQSRLGHYKWSGNQCSCGTWVVPAIQIPKSKVDVVQVNQTDLPAGAVVGGQSTLLC